MVSYHVNVDIMTQSNEILQANAALQVLYEHATGYALFGVKEFEEVASFLPQVEKSTQDLIKFKSLVKLLAFAPFKNAANALENTNSISEGILHADLATFLDANLPKKKKRSAVTLGVSDPKIGTAIQDNLEVTCTATGVVPEVIRGIRLHAAKLIEGLSGSSIGAAELSLGRTYSRAKVKFNVNRVDNMIIQSISLIDQLDKDINTFSMRLREWYSYHFPELIKIVSDNYNFSRLVKIIGNRKDRMGDDTLVDELETVVQDQAKAHAIVNAMKSSMGMDVSEIDFLNIHVFATKVINLAEYRRSLLQYLQSKMESIAPNLSSLIGEMVGARLISHAGSLVNLAKYPASTVQILGAEKALFRALKSRGRINTPKYGLIYHSTFIGKAGAKNKGRISRFLANKCSIASRVDCFRDDPTTVFGEMMKDQVEERLAFYESGQIPKKNTDVMKEAVERVKAETPKIKKEKKKKKRKASEIDNTSQSNGDLTQESIVDINGNNNEAVEEPPKKKKKKSKKNVE